MREEKEMCGSLFRNDKGDNPNRPDYNGRAMIDGKPYWVKGWIKDAVRDGKPSKWMSLAFEKREPLDKQDGDKSDLPF